MVSILVLVDAALRLSNAFFPSHRNRVSILVLVDAALRRYYHHSDIAGVQSFNPCFSGCRPAT